jgi:dephospho-CoA kinase
LIVGLTGGLAAGKNLVAGFLRELGAHVIDADKIAREILQPGMPAYKDVVKTFEHKILNNDGTIKRKMLAKIVFSNPALLKKLNAITHPKIIEEERKIARKILKKIPKAVIVMNAPLLIESGHHREMDKIIVVDVTEDIQIKRANKKGFTKEEALTRIKTQIQRKERLAYADFIINNNHNTQKTRENTRKVFEKLIPASCLGIKKTFKN